MTFTLDDLLSPYLRLYDDEDRQLGRVVAYDTKTRLATLADGSQVPVAHARLEGPLDRIYTAVCVHHARQTDPLV